MLYLVGLGLGDAKDITVKGLEIVRNADVVFLEAYTSILCVGQQVLEEFYGRQIKLADRETVEQNSDLILENAKDKDVAFLVVGDPFGATTHTDLVLRAHQLNIPYQVIHNASIMNAVGCCGLQLYNFGETVSIVLWTDSWKPDSFYDKIASNRKQGLHTLCLLDIKVKEQSVENMMRGRKIYEPPRYMSVNEAVRQLLDVIKTRDFKEESPAYTESSVAVGLARVGSANQRIVCGSMKELLSHDLGPPLHSLVIPGHLHFIEKDMLKLFALNASILDES
ncbi:PREDICTED: diphthine methyl ester synthase-like isoform X1 [Acropora digitifera]|uniref:diphthine methyl ester synthase-like isoform X1 n=1 Tax=Acropora digitifera TaxID=70779 RepID=UPI00077A5C5A|nr:PREDICTED: diphthine methyl ester synthase-like isoform X1 [Acropora digitifera]